MSAGVGALNSQLERLSKKMPLKNRKISVVFMNDDGSMDLDYTKEYNNGILLVPRRKNELDWESQNLSSKSSSKNI